MKMIDLGREVKECEPCCPAPAGKKKKYYPNLYISDVKGLNLSTGEITFTAKGRVVSVTDRQNDGEEGTCCCEIEIHEISKPAGDGAEGGLEEALESISKKKSREDDDE